MRCADTKSLHYLKEKWTEDFTKDLVGLLEHLGVKQAHLCGLSMGGHISFQTVIRYPERVMLLISRSETVYIKQVHHTTNLDNSNQINDEIRGHLSAIEKSERH